MMWKGTQVTSQHEFVLQVIPPYRGEEQEAVSLAAAMHSLVLDKRTPLALEMAGTKQERCFLMRTRSQAALDHVKTQLRARYPHLQFRLLAPEDDPLRLAKHERISVVELRPGAASYLPLQDWDEQQFHNEGDDPLFGILGALDALPDGVRLVTQLALIPASEQWSKRYQRKAIEHALDPEKEQKRFFQRREELDGGIPSMPVLVFGGLVLIVILNYQYLRTLLPSWFLQSLSRQAQGLPLTLSPEEQWQFYGSFVLVGVLCVFLFVGCDQLKRRWMQTTMYDSQLVRQKTTRFAYHVRLRCYAVVANTLDISSRGRATPTSLLASALHFFDLRRLHRELLARLIGAYRQFHLATGNYFVPTYLSSWQSRRCVSGGGASRWNWWRGLQRSSHLMSVTTLAALWHLPVAHTLPHLAFIEHRRTRTLPLPLSLLHNEQGHFLGSAEHAGHTSSFVLPKECLTKHLFIAGKSGEGKSTCMEHLAQTAMEQGGVVVIDPHGDLVEHILQLVPPSRKDDVLLLDIADTDYVVGFNPLDATLGRGRDKAVSDLLKTLAHIWASSWGPRMENAFEYALRTLFEANKYQVDHDRYQGPGQQYTLLDVMPVLTSESFCHSLLEHISDPFILRWWNLYYDPLSLTMQRDRSDPVLSKVAKFESQIARRILGQSQSTLDIAQCIRDEKILLVKLAKGVVGDDVARLIGSTLLGLIQITLEEQGVLSEVERKRLCIMVDEFQLFQGVDWSALAELRKYGAAFVLATQSPEYLLDVHDQLLPIVLANIKQYILFHLSARDAELLKREVGIEAEDIVNLDSYMCYLKLFYQGQRLPTFSLQMAPPPQGDTELAEAIRHDCRRRYGRPSPVVDQALHEAMIRTVAVPRQPIPSPGPEKKQGEGHGSVSLSGQSDDHKQESGDEDMTLAGIRQRTGYRGRKAQEGKKKEQCNTRQQQKPVTMDWQETAGSPVIKTNEEK